MAKGSFCFISSSSRGGSLCPKAYPFLLFVFPVMLSLMMFLPCEAKDQMDGFLNALLYADGCENFKDFDGSVETKASFPCYFDIKNVCSQSTSLCFPSTLIGLGTKFDGSHSEKSNFDVGKVGFCERSPLSDLNPVVFSSGSLWPPYVKMSPPSLDWGTNSLLTPSLVYLALANLHNSSVLHVFEPFSSDGQFYAYGFEKFSLAPGEASSIAFVFLPRNLGLVSAHIVLQTSFGGFVIHAKGVGIENPYRIDPFGGFELLADGRLSWNLSLYNPFDDALYVEEISARISISSENASHTEDLICNFGSFCKNSQQEVSWIEIRPHKQELQPHNTEIITKLNLWPPVKGNISGVICIKLQRFTRDKFDMVVVPLEAEVDSNPTYYSLTGSVSVFFESLVPYDGRGFVGTVSVRNRASYLLSVLSITENLEVFDIKYMEGLLLYPGTITQIALVSYDLPDVSEHIPPKVPWLDPNCRLSLLTNDSISPQIVIPCQGLVIGSGFIEPAVLLTGPKSQNQKLSNARTESLESIIEEPLPLELKFIELLEADRLILRNWRSQGTMSKLSVLKDQELLFPTVQIGTEFSKWITVHNPSQKPVIMQLVLNPGAIVDRCETPDDPFRPPLFKITSLEMQDGFSIPEPMTTAAIVHPLESAQIGPVLFRPSKQCTWRSSALIRNNLSGVEWLQIRAFGGSYSLLLLDGSEPVNKIEINLSKTSLLWTVMWKLLAVIFIACLVFFVFLHPLDSESKEYSVKNEKPIAVSRTEKPSRVHRSTRNARSIKKNEKLEEGLRVDRYPCFEHTAQENTQRVKERMDSDHQNKPTMQSPLPTEISESPETGNLTVKVVKERGRRRKRRVNGGGIASKFEVSSSQSGNSTPSSPMSPNAFTPNSSFSSQNHEKKQELSFSEEPRVSEPQKNVGKPVLLHSATFPSTSLFLASSSPIAPCARAPGSKLSKEKGTKTKEDVAFGKEYVYDIWGNHFCGLLIGKPKELSSKVFDASKGDSQSFFTSDPQSLMMMSSARSKSSGHQLTPPDVDYLYEKK
ncbi:uncharacterized protein A4U43_C03F4030 [Asparagus officinalis]|uniref:Uncharacterized protein n=1 Tax=Asparagus officinalis TaxID=4686 RepID=A0A5P1FCD5_ASPOF|nr:uncharacterized protein LOC109832865 [Asparagus officinalis]ONK74220.1 uncharacterized protein A4U43_C03F4030 [Asparagus officinalis]